MWAGIPHLFCGGQVHFVDVEVNQPCGGEAIIRSTSSEADDADVVFNAIIPLSTIMFRNKELRHKWL